MDAKTGRDAKVEKLALNDYIWPSQHESLHLIWSGCQTLL